MNRVPQSCSRLRSRDEGINRISDVIEVPARMQAAEPHDITVQALRDDAGNHGARGLPGPVRVEGAERYDRQVERQMERFREFVCADLAGRIRRLSLKRMLFIDRYVLRRSVDFARGRV